MRTAAPSPICQFVCVAFNRVAQVTDVFTLKKIRVFKAGVECLNSGAWNNGIGSRFYFVGSRA